jgi:uncharacterized protein (TIGR02996 family)
MPRFEFKEGTSSKFWEITQDDDVLVTRWGRIGAEGQDKKQKFKSFYEARKAYQKQMLEKLEKGYKRIKPKNTGPTPRSNPELEAAILKDPDNVDGYLVYGDWLQAQGDPRGELIALQHALLGTKGSAATTLKKKIKTLIGQHEDLLLGTVLAPMRLNETLAYQWHLGFLRSARVKAYHWGEDPDFEVSEVVALLLAHPSARFIQELTIGLPSNDGDTDYNDVIKAIAKAAPKALRSLFLGDFRYPDDTEISWSKLGKVSLLYPAVPQLRSLRLRGGDLNLGKVDLPELREFIVESGGLQRSTVKSIAAASWPKLERLEVWFGSEDYGAGGDEDDIQPILDGKGLPQLKHLGLCNAGFSQGLARVLPKSKVLRQLESLDLSKGTLMDEDAEVLAANAAAFKHLKHLDLSENLLTSKGAKLVAKLCPDVARGNQRDTDDFVEDEDGRRYVAVGE